MVWAKWIWRKQISKKSKFSLHDLEQLTELEVNFINN